MGRGKEVGSCVLCQVLASRVSSVQPQTSTRAGRREGMKVCAGRRGKERRGVVPPCLLVSSSNWSGLNDSVMSTYVTHITKYISIPVFLLGRLKFVDPLKEMNFKIFQMRYWHLRRMTEYSEDLS